MFRGLMTRLLICSKGYSSETSDARDERLALEEAAAETRNNRSDVVLGGLQVVMCRLMGRRAEKEFGGGVYS